MNFAVYFEQCKSNAVKFSKNTLPKWACYFGIIPKSEIKSILQSRGRGRSFYNICDFWDGHDKTPINLENENPGINRRQQG